MAMDKNKIAGDCWKRGTEALGKQNWDYAIEMFRQAVRLVPDNKLYRETLRGAAEKKYKNNGSGARMANAKLMGLRTKLKKARMMKDWESVDKLAEDGFAINPWDGQLNHDLGDACAARGEAATDAGDDSLASGFQSIAVFSYQRALEATPGNRALLRALALQYEARQNYRQAIECWEKIRRMDPHDAESRSKCSQLAAQSTINEANFDDAQSTKDVMADHEVASRIKSGQQQADGPGMSLEADLQRAIRKEPENKDNYLKIADYYERAGKLAEAVEMLNTALKLSNNDPNIREKLEDIELSQANKNVVHAKELANKENTEANVKRARELETNYVKREVQILTQREQRYPSDMRVKLELAIRLMRFAKWQKAIPLLQKAATDTRVRGEALVRLGMCFNKDNKPQLAQHQLEQAITEVDHESNPKMYKEMLYLLGTICEKSDEVDSAIKSYSMLLAVDYGYRDAVKRLENLQSRPKR
ncbi:cellulose synthase subunit BcsC [Symmachiella macrocystis]|uniref:Cellulose synthase subunit BcsC n=1 Tax=Symmachiella macrocystis TaxID=2527985 RepID=A0A5C6BS36_9PLAN|nr:tetratricopeptide repeat protein [Symmachiella macrocystis]TWU14251.1 cellulose synthase subunit BcsC [Symmachiella macrocystis]